MGVFDKILISLAALATLSGGIYLIFFIGGVAGIVWGILLLMLVLVV